MQRTSPNGSFKDLATHHPGATLFDFDIDGESLKSAHTKWLDDNIVQRIRGTADTWRISLIGTTDRLGKAGHNQGLSERRAMNVQRYIRTHSALGGVKIVFETLGRGEQHASQTDKDETANPLERAVLVTMNLFSQPQPLPVPAEESGASSIDPLPHIPRISSCVTKATCPKSTEFEIRIEKGQERSLRFAGGAEFTFLLRDTKNRLEARYDFTSQKGLSISPTPLSITSGATRFSNFRTSHQTRVVDFGLSATLTIPPTKPGVPISASLSVNYDKGTFLHARQEITKLDTGNAPLFSAIPGLSVYVGSFLLVSKCDAGDGAVRL